MKEGHLHLSAVVGDFDWEKTGILVVNMDEIDAVIRSKSRETQALPMKQILGDREGNPGTDGCEALRKPSHSAEAVQQR